MPGVRGNLPRNRVGDLRACGLAALNRSELKEQSPDAVDVSDLKAAQDVVGVG